jgi:hypothetical protein
MPYQIVPFQDGFRVRSDNGTFFSKRPLSKTMAKRQMRALYAKEKNGEIFHGGSFTMMYHGGRSHLIKTGDGFLGDIFAKVKDIANKAVSVVKQAVPTAVQRVVEVTKGARKDYPPKVRKIIQQYGDGMVSNLLIRREPIQSFINTALNLITLGKWGIAKNELNYDKLYHLSAVAMMRLPNGQTKHIVIEKNEVININDRFKMTNTMEFISVPVQPPVPFAKLMQNAQANGGDSYFIYDAFNANCQMFIMNIINGNDLNTPMVQSFVLQPVDSLLQKLPNYVSPFAKIATDIAGLANVALEGRGAPTITMPAKDYFAEHKDLIELLSDSAKKLKAEADTQAKEVKQRKGKGKEKPVIITTLIPPHPTTLTPDKIKELLQRIDFDDESKADKWKVVSEVLDYLLSDDDFLQNSGDVMSITSAKAEMPTDLTRANPDRWANVIRNVLEVLEPKKEGSGFDQAKFDRLQANIPTKEEWEARRRKGKSKQTYEAFRASAEKLNRSRAFIDDAQAARREQGLQQAERSNQEYLQKIAENPDLEDVVCNYDEKGDRKKTRTTRGQCRLNNEAHIRKTDTAEGKFFRPIVEGLTKAGDFAVKYIAPAVGVPKVVTETYKAFAPPGSEFNKGGAVRRAATGKAHGNIPPALYKGGAGFQDALYNWFNSYLELFDILEDIPDEAVQSNLIELQEEFKNQYRNTIASIRRATVKDKRGTPEYQRSQDKKRELVENQINRWHGMLNYIIEMIGPGYAEQLLRYIHPDALIRRFINDALDNTDIDVREARAVPLASDEPIAYTSPEDPSKVYIPQTGSGLPTNYLAAIRRKAKAKGYDPKTIRLAKDGKHKVEIDVGERVVKFGKHGMADFEIYKQMEREKKIPKGTAAKHREDYLKRSGNIKGNWRDDKFSKNNLARELLW